MGSAVPTAWRASRSTACCRAGSARNDGWEYPYRDHSWEAETAEFIAAIDEGRQPIGNADEAVATMSVIERIYQEAMR
jgi:predicted dehydrogenase